MKPRYFSIIIVLLLLNYIIFATLFTRLLDYGSSESETASPRQPQATFTPAPALPPANIPTLTPYVQRPTPTNTRVVLAQPASQPDLAPTATNPARLSAPGTVNLRAGPSINFEIVGTLNANVTMPIVGRNADASWWQIEINNGSRGWVSGTVVEVQQAEGVPVVE